jgi:hypothetical protein
VATELRPASAADAPAIAREIVDRVTKTGGNATDPPPYRRMLAAVAAADGGVTPAWWSTDTGLALS